MFLALRELKHSKLRYVLVALIMILIAWLVLFVTGLAKGLSADNASSIQKMNADYLVLQKEADHRLNRSVLPEEKVKAIGQYTNKQETASLGIQMTTLTKQGSDKKIDVTFFAVDTKGLLAPEITDGNMIDNNTTNKVVADSSLKSQGLKIGDQIEDQSSGKTFKLIGFTKDQSFSHAPVLHMNFKEWQMIHQSTAQKKPFYNTVALNVTKNQANTIAKNVSGIEVIDKSQALKGIPGYSEEQGTLIMMIVFLFIIAAFVLAVFFYVITLQKMNQFGVLKAIGAKTSHLARTIISQVLLLTVGSLIISVALTFGVAFILPDSMPFDLSPKLVLICSLLFLVVSMLGSLLSLYRVAKIDAIEAIGRAV